MCNGLSPTDSSFLASSQLTTSFHWPYYCTIHVYVVIHIDANLCRFLSFVCMHCRQLSKEEGWDPINRFKPSTFLCMSQSRNQFSIVICRGLLVLEVFVRFVDIDEIIDHHCVEVIVRFVGIGVSCWPSLFRGVCSLCWYWWNYWLSLCRGDCSVCWYWCELLTITV